MSASGLIDGTGLGNASEAGPGAGAIVSLDDGHGGGGGGAHGGGGGAGGGNDATDGGQYGSTEEPRSLGSGGARGLFIWSSSGHYAAAGDGGGDLNGARPFGPHRYYFISLAGRKSLCGIGWRR